MVAAEMASSLNPGRWCWSWPVTTPDAKWSSWRALMTAPQTDPTAMLWWLELIAIPTKWQLPWARRKSPRGQRSSLLWKFIIIITSCPQGTLWISPWTKLLSTRMSSETLLSNARPDERQRSSLRRGKKALVVNVGVWFHCPPWRQFCLLWLLSFVSFFFPPPDTRPARTNGSSRSCGFRSVSVNKNIFKKFACVFLFPVLLNWEMTLVDEGLWENVK